MAVQGPSRFLVAALAGILAGCSGSQVLESGDADAYADWSPPIDGLGTPGWRDSGTPWVPDEHVRCREIGSEGIAFDVRATAAGLFAVWSRSSPNIHEGSLDYRRFYTDVRLNDGSGWTSWLSAECENSLGRTADPRTGCVSRILGDLDGRLLGRGWETTGPLKWVTPEGLADVLDVPYRVYDPFIVRDDLAYAIWPGVDAKVIQWDGTTWTPLEAILPYEDVMVLWADETSLFVAGDRGTVLTLEAGAWRDIDLPSTAVARSIWGFGADDVWVGTNDGSLYRWDGTTWTPMEWPRPEGGCNTENSIIGMWGADGVLFLRTSFELVRWDGTTFNVLGNWPSEDITVDYGSTCSGGLRILRMTGYSPTELFLGVAPDSPGDVIYEESSPEDFNLCYAWPLILWWDGTTFHQL